MQLAELGRWTSFPSTLGDRLPGVVSAGPCRATEPTQAQRMRGGQSSWERGVRTSLESLISGLQRKARKWRKQKILDEGCSAAGLSQHSAPRTAQI